MGRYRIQCARLRSVEAVIKFEIATDSPEDIATAIKNMVKVIDIAAMYEGQVATTDQFVDATIDEEFPYGTVCLLKFEKHSDAIKFLGDIIPD